MAIPAKKKKKKAYSWFKLEIIKSSFLFLNKY